jgi:ABC-type molybdenum transport system ATPase subunit/photorepair protein PhrA
MRIRTTVSTAIHDSFRIRQLAGMFDVAIGDTAAETFAVEIPGPEEAWDIGVIVGPSGSGKSTIARAAFGDALVVSGDWQSEAAVVDGFGDHPITQITQALTSVGFSSPPAWLKPYAVLSNGERFRCDLARALLNGGKPGGLVVFDEFTSVVDRTVAKVASAAVAKSIRAGRLARRFVAVTCHYDIVDWLSPDWVVDMASRELARGRLCRPQIPLRITRCRPSAWSCFKRHHYLTASLHRGSSCFLACVDGRPAAFTAVLAFPHPIRPGWREHRTVCLPDFQGLGIGNALSEFVAALYVATGRPYFSTTGHPAMIRHRAGSPLWRMSRPPGRMNAGGRKSRPTLTATLARTSSKDRNTASFEFVGPPRRDEARAFGLH